IARRAWRRVSVSQRRVEIQSQGRGGARSAQCVPLGRTTGRGRRVVWNGVPSSSVSAHVTRVGHGGSGVKVTWNSRHAACRYPTFMVIPPAVSPLLSKKRAAPTFLSAILTGTDPGRHSEGI